MGRAWNRKANVVAELDGLWEVQRTGGALPPMIGVRKRIQGSGGETTLGPFLRVPFDIDGLTLRYRRPLRGFVDKLEPAGLDFHGRATFRGREYGQFSLRRIGASPSRPAEK